MNRYKMYYKLEPGLPEMNVLLDAEDEDDGWRNGREFCRDQGPACRIVRFEVYTNATIKLDNPKWHEWNGQPCGPDTRQNLLDRVQEPHKGNITYSMTGDTIFIAAHDSIMECRVLRHIYRR